MRFTPQPVFLPIMIFGGHRFFTDYDFGSFNDDSEFDICFAR